MSRALLGPVALGLVVRAALLAGLTWALIALEAIALADSARAAMVGAGALAVLAVDALRQARSALELQRRSRQLAAVEHAFLASHRPRGRAP